MDQVKDGQTDKQDWADLFARSSIISSLEHAKYSEFKSVCVLVKVFQAVVLCLVRVFPSCFCCCSCCVRSYSSKSMQRKAMLISLMIGRFYSLSLRSNHHHHQSRTRHQQHRHQHHHQRDGISAWQWHQCASASTPHSSLFLQMTHFVLLVLYWSHSFSLWAPSHLDQLSISPGRL